VQVARARSAHVRCYAKGMERALHEKTKGDGYDRVRAHASCAVNARLDRLTDDNVRRAKEDPQFAARRLAEIDREWEMDRAILLGFATMGGLALVLGLARSRLWRVPLAAQIGFLVAHAVVGWCPPAAVLRHLGFRTRQEIDDERCALSHGG